MINALTNTLNKVSNAINAIAGATSEPSLVKTNQTCLERFGIEARNTQLLRNEWKRDLQYTKALVDAEYIIQTEFKVSSYEDRLMEQEQYKAQRQAEKDMAKAENRKAKKKKKDADMEKGSA